MSRKLIGILCLLFSSCLVAVPASAVTLPDCGPNADGTNHFTFVSKNLIDLEGGNVAGQTVINSSTSTGDAGNFLVTGLAGTVRVGPNVTVNGTVIADTIVFEAATSKITGSCIANHITGVLGIGLPIRAANCALADPVPGAPFTNFLNTTNPNCVNNGPPDTTGPTFEALCGPTPMQNTCVNLAPNLTVLPGPTVNIPDSLGSCFKTVTIKPGGVLSVTGTVTFGNLVVNSGGLLKGDSPVTTPPTDIVNVTKPSPDGGVLTSAGAMFSDIRINVVRAGNAVVLGGGTKVHNTVFNAPFGTCHPHGGTELTACSEFCCFFNDIEPVKGQCEVVENPVCKCDPGFQFVLNGTGLDHCVGVADGGTCESYRACCRTEAGFPDSCAPVGG